MNDRFFGFDLTGGVTESVSEETWSDIDSETVVAAMVESVPTERQHLLCPGFSLAMLAEASDPYYLSEETRASFARRAPQALEMIDRWRAETEG